MSTNLPINHLVLLEIIIILAIGLVVVLVTAFRQHFMLKKLFAKFIELRESRDGSNTQNSAPLEVYFARSINDSRRQYETLTSSKTIIFDTTSPYSQKVIALRYLYLTVEKEAEEQRLIRPVGWDFYETKLDLLLKLINKGKESNDVGVLQAQLDQSRTESTTTINLLKDMIDKLQNSLAPSTSITVEKGMQDILDAISSNESILNIKDLFEQIKFLSSQLKISPNLVERSISTLEYEVEVSDKYLTKIRSNPNPVTVDLKEIKKLRESNKIQRNTIASLEDEINALRNSVTKNTSAEIRAETEAEISRLALAVKEYEGCVKILEEQIDSLYAQVESKSEQQEHTPTNQQKEMETLSTRMNKTVNDFRCASSLNRSIYSLCQCASVKEMASIMVTLLKEFEVSAGFMIQSSAGKLDYFPPKIFDEALKASVKKSNNQEHIYSLNGNTLFVDTRIKLLLLFSENVPDTMNTTISGLVCAVNANILRLESISSTRNNQEKIDKWADSAKSKIADIDIQYAYQVEERGRIYNEFIADLKKFYELLNPQEESAVLLDNAISQYEARIELSVLSAEIIDRELTNFVTHISSLKL